MLHFLGRCFEMVPLNPKTKRTTENNSLSTRINSVGAFITSQKGNNVINREG